MKLSYNLDFNGYSEQLSKMKVQLTHPKRYTLRTRLPYNADRKLRQPSYNAVLSERGFYMTQFQHSNGAEIATDFL